MLRLGPAILNIIELALLRPIEDCDCDIVLLRGREAGAMEAFPLVSSFIIVTDYISLTGNPDAVTRSRHWTPETGPWAQPVDSRGLSLVTAVGSPSPAGG